MALFLYRKGDGNDGNFPRYVVEIPDTICLASALHALVVNDYISGHHRRRWISKHLETYTDDREYGARAEIYQGPRGIMAYDSCWLTAELQPIVPKDCQVMELSAALDKGARALLRKA